MLHCNGALATSSAVAGVRAIAGLRRPGPGTAGIATVSMITWTHGVLEEAIVTAALLHHSNVIAPKRESIGQATKIASLALGALALSQ